MNKLMIVPILLLMFFPSKLASADEHEFFKGKTIHLIVGTAPGGGFDTYSRVIARHMGRHIPGNPTMLAETKKANLDLDPKSGEQLEKIVKGFFNADPVIVKRLAKILY